MAAPYYKIDHAVCDPLDLWDREAMVYSALLYLCKLGPYKGSANELRLFCQIKSKSTILRILSLLIEKGLVSRTPDGILVNQYGSQVVHNGAGSNHIGAISKEKSIKKENIIKEINNNYSLETDIKSKQQQRVFFDNFSPPSWDEVVQYASEKKIPQSLYTQFFSYYTANGWKLKRGATMENWKATLTYWVEKEKKDATKTIYQGIYGRASEQEQASFIGSQYAEYLARKEREKQEETARQADEETRFVSYEEYKKQK